MVSHTSSSFILLAASPPSHHHHSHVPLDFHGIVFQTIRSFNISVQSDVCSTTQQRYLRKSSPRITPRSIPISHISIHISDTPPITTRHSSRGTVISYTFMRQPFVQSVTILCPALYTGTGLWNGPILLTHLFLVRRLGLGEMGIALQMRLSLLETMVVV